ncbi:hypothetical protein AAFC00_000640 [Neodothiora populina]|uniref:Increased recombination centers protein 6 n=1 Tax=Neodothiora populina TaxID=2781224 RepID=A0ABR3PDQ2_9PEZI
MEIKHPRRILVLGTPECDISRILKDLTGSLPPSDTSGSLAGVTHEWSVETNYYNANLPIWIDEVSDLEQWKNEFMKPEAKEVIEAVGAWIFCFSRPSGHDDKLGVSAQSSMEAIGDVIENACGYAWDGTRLAIDASRTAGHKESLEEECMEHSFEYIHADATGKNEFGELQGIERAKEALQANDWNPQSSDTDEDDALGDIDTEKAQFNSELWGLKASLLDPDIDDEAHGDEEFQILDMEHMMSQLLAIRETSAAMPESQRRAFASRAVNDLMKDL